MFAKISYYIFVVPFSHLPLPVMYIFTDFLYLLLISFVPYRKDVIEANIARSFPNKSLKERKAIKRKFYRHFTDMLAEGIKSLTISKKELQKRLTVKNPEIMQDLYASGKNVLLVSGHYNNWEWLVTGQGLLFEHKAVGIGMPLSSTFWDDKINDRRSRYGMKVVHAKNYASELDKMPNEKIAILVLSDQAPGNSLKSYWMDFLNQNTAVRFGAELMANQLDYAVVFFATRKIKRGYYQMELSSITDNPKDMKWGEITEAHTHLLENEIKSAPQYWLWSHKRWKREVPDDLENLKKQQRESFNSKFGK